MIKYIFIFLTIVITSCFFFPFGVNAVAGLNSKMALAGIGLIVLLYQLAKEGNGGLRKDLIAPFAASFLVSLIAFLAAVINDTHEYTYATYFISFAVWTSGAYVAITVIKKVHNACSVELIIRYLIAVCVLQCILALLFQSFPALGNFFQTYTSTLGAGASMGGDINETRLYGVGAALDIAGTRFGAVLVLIAAALSTTRQSKKWLYFYIISWMIIVVVGNMISRTTIIGAALSIFIVLVNPRLFYTSKETNKEIRKAFLRIVIIAIPLCTILYHTNDSFYKNMRFGFEGVFSLVEKGSWEVSSNTKLGSMYKYPDNAKTWIIGDGYFEGQKADPYYTGRNWVFFYMGTDVGYLRFIFYFGLTGLAAFMLFFVIVCKNCIERFHKYRWVFVFLLALNFIIWFKVSTDIYVVFAPFLCLSAKDNDEYEKEQETENEDKYEEELLTT